MAKIVFESPVEIGGKEVAELELREPKVKDLRLAGEQAGGNMVEYELRLAANLASLSMDEIDELPAKAYGQIQKELKAFL